MSPFESMPLSSHARHRAGQRGKRREALNLVYRHGDIERRCGRDRVRLRLSRGACQDLVGAGVAPRDVERAARVELVVAEDGTVVTVLHAVEK